MKKLYVAMYHYIRELHDSRYPAIKGLDYGLFKQQIEFFEQNFHVVTMQQVLEAIEGGPLPQKALLLTFDDGYIDHDTFALPVLKAHHMQGAFFIPGKTFTENSLLDVNKIHFILASASESEILKSLLQKMDFYRGSEYRYPLNKELFLEYGKENRFDTKETIFIKRMLQTVLPENVRNKIAADLFEEFVGIDERVFAKELYMNRDQIGCMKRNGMFIGVHGYDHYWLGHLDRKEMEKDIERALEVMDEWIDRKSWVMNYPYGNFQSHVIRYITGRGCKLGFTTEVRIADLHTDDKYQIPRLDCNDFPPKSERYREEIL